MSILYKLPLFLILLLSYFLSSGLVYLTSKLLRRRFLRILNKIISFHCYLALKVFGVKVKVSGLSHVRSSGLFVANHLSYIDILILSSIKSCSFITSTDMRDTFFLGEITKLAGCVFVNRGDRSNINNEIQDITQALANGVTVCLYPEATSTNGERVLDFKRSMFKAALNAKVPIYPICLNYRTINGQKVSSSNRDYICWYGKMDFFRHFSKFIGLKEVQASLDFFSPIEYQADKTHKEVASESYEVISQAYVNIT